MTDITFLDTETLGLDPDAPVWEFAAIRRSLTGTERTFHCFIDHVTNPWIDDLPEGFQKDYWSRYNRATAVTTWDAANIIYSATHNAHIIGAVPSFDTLRLGKILRRAGLDPEPWHYHLCDVENLIVGYLAANGEILHPPWDSTELSKAMGVNPANYERHTAMGDVHWAKDLYDAVMSQRKAELPT
jgi:hypothetical protein